jgi:hypothetical protein
LTEIIQVIIGSACLCFEPVPASVNKEDMSRFFAVVWATHPDLIPNEVGCIVPKLEEQLVGLAPLLIQADELIHSKQDVLHFSAFIHILKVHDLSLLEEDDDDPSSSLDSSNDGDDGYPDYDVGPGFLLPWPKVYRLAGDSDVASNLLP